MKSSKCSRYEHALQILETIRKSGHEAYFVGGCVRDYLLKHPVNEYDIATNAPPAAIQKLFAHTIPVGISFGVVLVLIEGIQYEVATYRREDGYADGRHPENVHFSDRKSDALRRDFTINALYWDPFSQTILDDIEGRKDLENRIIRAINDPFKRFSEDYLRMLRAIRFAAYLYDLEFTLEKKTGQAIKKLAPNITKISPERQREELTKMLLGPHPDKAVKMLDQYGLLEHILPEVSNLKKVAQPPEFHPEGDVFEHTLLTLHYLKPAPSIEAAWAALLHDIGKPSTYTEAPDRIRFNNHCRVGAEMAEQILMRLRFSKLHTAAISKIIKHHMEFINIPQMRISRLKRVLARPTIEDEIALHRADCLASHKKMDTYEYLLDKKRGITIQEAQPDPVLTGTDLIELGFSPGPLFKEILEKVYEAQLENQVINKDEARNFVIKHFREK